MRWMNCKGWWEQDFYGRQEMTDLQLSFADGKISGQGRDVVGEFTLFGQLENEKVLLRKHYVGKHAVDYPGVFDGEGTMQGIWNIGNFFGGKWMIHVVRPETSSLENVQEMQF